eukprot:Lankesteria_metandrocarpae@DN4566_c1_g1_i1.p1
MRTSLCSSPPRLSRRSAALLACVAVLCILPTPCRPAVIGLEIGNEFVKAGIVAPGKPFEILLNQHSKRKTPTAVSFATDRIAYGDDALSQSTRSATNVFEFLPSLLAINATDLMSNSSPISSSITVPPPMYSALI